MDTILAVTLTPWYVATVSAWASVVAVHVTVDKIRKVVTP